MQLKKNTTVLNRFNGANRAELYSEDGRECLALIVLGYEFPQSKSDSDANWLEVILEYSDSDLVFTTKTNDFDAESVADSAKALSKPCPNLHHQKTILEPPYGAFFRLQMSLQTPKIISRFKKIRTGRTFPPFNREHSGIFVTGKFFRGNFQFSFKTNRPNLKNFFDQLSQISKQFPSRYKGANFDNAALIKYLSPIRHFEGQLHSCSKNEKMVQWSIQRIEELVSLAFEPIDRILRRRIRRQIRKPHRYTETENSQLRRLCENQIRNKINF